jgi:Heterokaryon incompatibility protein (HET)
MPINSLPRTFQDAIMAVREFNIRYIWIDSLCIIQDSDEDWKFEAAQMDVVYRNAIYNIAATKGTDSESGLFTERKPFSLHPIHVDLNGQDPKNGTLSLTTVSGQWKCSRHL